MARTSGTRKLIKEGMQKLALEGVVAGAGAGAPDADDVGPGVGAAGGSRYVPIGAGLSYVNDAVTGHWFSVEFTTWDVAFPWIKPT
jgi:hypothetical protein